MLTFVNYLIFIFHLLFLRYLYPENNEIDQTGKELKEIIDYEPMIMSVIKKLGIMYDQDEYMQIGRIAVYTGQSKYDKTKTKCTIDQFIYTNIYQRIVDQIRKESKYQKRNSVTEDSILDMHEDHLNFDVYLFQDLMTELDSREQFVCMRLVEGYKLREIAKMLNVSNSTAKNIRARIRKQLKQYFYPLEI